LVIPKLIGMTLLTGFTIEEEEGESAEHEEEEEHHHEAGNPHVWLDPVLAQQQVATIGDRLIAINPTNADSYRTNAGDYIEFIEYLNSDYSRIKLPLFPFLWF
jgi:zinc transport system substrate-binding protein